MSARFHRLLLPALGVSCLVFMLGGAYRLSGYEAWDDGLMFSRYAENLAVDGQVAWNPAEFGGEPTWGLTSLGHFAWVSVLRAALSPAGGDELMWAVASSWLAGCGFLVLMLWAAWRHGNEVDGVPRFGLVAWTAVCLALGFRSVGSHLGTGMDTMTALCWLTGFLIFARDLERRPSSKAAICTAGMAGFTFFVRPDATLFPAAVLAALVVFGRDRRRALVASVGAAAILASVWGAARVYLGSWLPLPFYAKSGAHYGEAFAVHYEGVALHELGLFAFAFWLPILTIAFELVVQPRRWWRESSAVDKGLGASVLVFGAYHLTQVAPIMGGSQRFYQPMVPALLWLSWGSLLRLRAWNRRASVDNKPRLALAAMLLALSLVLAVAGEVLQLRKTLQRQSWVTLDLDSVYSQRARHYWPALDVVASLPPDTLIAATEVGLVGAMNPRKSVIDLAGLHDPEFSLQGFSADRLFRSDRDDPRRPDVIYLPHPHYEVMLEDLMRHPVVQSEYRVWTAEQLGSVLGVAVRRGSVAEEPLAAALEPAAETVTGARSRR